MAKTLEMQKTMIQNALGLDKQEELWCSSLGILHLDKLTETENYFPYFNANKVVERIQKSHPEQYIQQNILQRIRNEYSGYGLKTRLNKFEKLKEGVFEMALKKMN
jgi:hypothetical protein